MNDRAALNELVDEMERSLLFAEACAEVTDLRALLGRACACLLDDVQADVAAVVLPAEGEQAPVVHYTSRRPLLYEGERAVRETGSEMVRRYRLGDASAVTLARGADLDPLWDGLGDAPLYPIATRPLVAQGARVGVLLLLARTDWIVSPRTERRLDGGATTLGRALAQALEVARLRAAAEAAAPEAAGRPAG